jgi:hypothetical protein
MKICQFCKKLNLKISLDLGFLPPVNVMYKVGEHRNKIDFFPLEFGHCLNCGLVQISDEINSEIVFPETYPYLSGMTKSLVKNFENQANLVMDKIKVDKDDLIVDIGSNDGSLLEQYVPYMKVLGVEPTAASEAATIKGIETLHEFFSGKIAQDILEQYGKAKVVTACNVFAHIPDLNDLLGGISKLLHDDGIFVSESHYLFDLLNDLQFDTIYHEHLRYYSTIFIVETLKQFNLEVFHVQKIPTHGGSIRVWAGRPDKFLVDDSVRILTDEERKIDLDIELQKFTVRIHNWRSDFRNLISTLTGKNFRIIGVGAPSRSSTLVSYAGLNEQDLLMVAELKNSEKIGKYMPGTKIPIVEESEALRNNPDYLLLLSWHISQEIIANIRDKGYKGGFIIPLPQPYLIEPM